MRNYSLIHAIILVLCATIPSDAVTLNGKVQCTMTPRPVANRCIKAHSQQKGHIYHTVNHVHRMVKKVKLVKQRPKLDETLAWIGVQYNRATGEILWIWSGSSLNQYGIEVGDYFLMENNIPMPLTTQGIDSKRRVGNKIRMTIRTSSGILKTIIVTYLPYSSYQMVTN